MKIYLDLLPPQLKKEVKRKKIFLEIIKQEMLFIIPLVLFIFILLDTVYILNLQKKSILNQHITDEMKNKAEELSLYENKFRETNENSNILLKIKSEQLHWTKLFEKMNEIVPENVNITDISNKDFKIFIVGKSKNREELINFKNNLEKEVCFNNINVPLSNLVVKEDIDFQLDFFIDEKCLKEKND